MRIIEVYNKKLLMNKKINILHYLSYILFFCLCMCVWWYYNIIFAFQFADKMRKKQMARPIHLIQHNKAFALKTKQTYFIK